MIVKGPDEKSAQRCDACMKLNIGTDQFKQLILPNRWWVIAQAISRHLPIPPELPPLWFKGIGTASHPDHPAQLHACPTCEPKVKRAVFEAKIDDLPPGELRNVLRAMHHKALKAS